MPARIFSVGVNEAMTVFPCSTLQAARYKIFL